MNQTQMIWKTPKKQPNIFMQLLLPLLRWDARRADCWAAASDRLSVDQTLWGRVFRVSCHHLSVQSEECLIRLFVPFPACPGSFLASSWFGAPADPLSWPWCWTGRGAELAVVLSCPWCWTRRRLNMAIKKNPHTTQYNTTQYTIAKKCPGNAAVDNAVRTKGFQSDL